VFAPASLQREDGSWRGVPKAENKVTGKCPDITNVEKNIDFSANKLKRS
jgi:hypothetical protein